MYKVEFIQLCDGFILCQILLVIQHLETMYLGGNNVRVICERVWRFDQECATRRWLTTRLTTDSRVVTCQNEEHMWSMQEDEESG